MKAMANVVDNTIMNPSTIGYSSSLKLPEEEAVQNASQRSSSVQPAESDTKRGWLPMGMGENVDLLV
jgi:hypothetical protein